MKSPINHLLKLELMEELLPNLYTGFSKGNIRIKISSVATISIDFDTKEEEEPVDETNDLEDDLWK